MPFEQTSYVISEASLLMSIMDQAIIQVAISSVETFDCNKIKFEALVASVEIGT